MRLFIQIFVTGIVCFVIQSIFPWWTAAVAAFMVGFVFSNSGFRSFVAGFIGVGLVWGIMPWFIQYSTQSDLAQRVGQLLPINVFMLTILIGALAGGFASLTGSLLKPSK
ncbi:MAG: hypothetical protein AB7K37_14915 [Cyclobacteriaceae bacterium]